jgi:hypothetical protein
MNSLVALPIAGALPIALTGPDVAAASEADPIFAAIEAHKTARITWIEWVHRNQDLK